MSCHGCVMAIVRRLIQTQISSDLLLSQSEPHGEVEVPRLELSIVRRIEFIKLEGFIVRSSHSERDECELKCLQKFVSFEHRLFAKVCELRVFAKVCNLERMRGLQSIKPGSYPVGVEE